jgi:hypothetical protein
MDFNITLPSSAGTTLQDEIQCYDIPYGLIGFVSHLVSYYMIAITAAGRPPLAPLSKLKAKNRVRTALQLFGTMGLTIYTMHAFHDRWQFVLIAVWKLFWNVFKGSWQITTTWKASEKESIKQDESREEIPK